jgi:hypothetical protein
MADRRIPDDPIIHRDDGPTSATAIISYLLIGCFLLIATMVWILIAYRVQVDPAMLTVLGAIVTAAVTALGVVGGFWLASSIGSRMESKASNAAMRQLAGAGPPPPADPLAPPPASTPEAAS